MSSTDPQRGTAAIRFTQAALAQGIPWTDVHLKSFAAVSPGTLELDTSAIYLVDDVSTIFYVLLVSNDTRAKWLKDGLLQADDMLPVFNDDGTPRDLSDTAVGKFANLVPLTEGSVRAGEGHITHLVMQVSSSNLETSALASPYLFQPRSALPIVANLHPKPDDTTNIQKWSEDIATYVKRQQSSNARFRLHDFFTAQPNLPYY